MNIRRTSAVLALGLVVGVGGASANYSLAATPGAPAAVLLAAPITSAFSYEGRLAVANGTYDLKFRLFDAASGGALVGTPNTVLVNDRGVSSSQYFVSLDFGTGAFTGDARYLEVSYRVGTSTGAYTLQSGRQPLQPTPYALSLRPGAQVTGNVPTGQAVLRANNTGAGIGLYGYSVGSVGVVGSSANSNGMQGASTKANGVYGQTSVAHSSTSAGVYGRSTGDGGIGVIGEALTGNTWGVYGKTQVGIGVYGNAATTGTGVQGNSVSGIGVYGDSTNYEGVRGVGRNVNHAAVYGNNTANGFGVFGQSGNGAGVVGTSTGWVGVYGESASAMGVSGKSTTGAGTTGESRDWMGVYGVSTNYEGVRGESRNAGHGGVVGVNTAGGIAVYGIATNGGYAMYADGKMGTKVLEIQGGSDLAERFNVSDEAEAAPGTLMVIDPEHPGKLMASTSAYDAKVAGVVSGAGGINPGLTLHQTGVMEGDHVVAIAGRVYVKADATHAPIRAGDLLTSSDISGTVMKAVDRERAAGTIIGKAMSGLDSGTGMVLVLVNLQ